MGTLVLDCAPSSPGSNVMRIWVADTWRDISKGKRMELVRGFHAMWAQSNTEAPSGSFVKIYDRDLNDLAGDSVFGGIYVND